MTFIEIKRRLSKKKVGIAGCGGLGSNCAVALARVGVGTLVLIDFDYVEESNLNRQYYFNDQIGQSKVEALAENIKRINPAVNINMHHLKLDASNMLDYFTDVDVLVEAFDQAAMKQLLIEVYSTANTPYPLIVGNGMAGFGKSNLIQSNSFDTIIVCGDNESEIAPENPPLAPRVGIVANMQANEVLEILLNS